MSVNSTSSNLKRSATEFLDDVSMLNAEIQELYCQDEIPWIIGVSWGKDSSCVLQLIWNAIATLPKEKRTLFNG